LLSYILCLRWYSSYWRYPAFIISILLLCLRNPDGFETILSFFFFFFFFFSGLQSSSFLYIIFFSKKRPNNIYFVWHESLGLVLIFLCCPVYILHSLSSSRRRFLNKIRISLYSLPICGVALSFISVIAPHIRRNEARERKKGSIWYISVFAVSVVLNVSSRYVFQHALSLTLRPVGGADCPKLFQPQQMTALLACPTPHEWRSPTPIRESAKPGTGSLCL